MRNLRHLTPRYLAARAAAGWYYWRHPDVPWLTRRAIEFLASWLRPTDVGLEWGSGRSTKWLGRRVARLISIENERPWYDRVRRSLPMSVDYRLIAWDDYVAQGEKLPDDCLDFALVDGHIRDECLLVAMRKVRPGGIVILDNANWYLPHETRSPASARRPVNENWAAAFEELRAWRLIWTTNGVTDTAIWVKPT